MLTQKWQRYHLPNAIKGQYMHPSCSPEQNQTLTGRVIKNGFLGQKGLKEGKVSCLIPSLNLFKETQTDSKGYFQLVDIDLPDSLVYMIQAVANNGSSEDIELNIDPEVFPEVIPSKGTSINTKEAAISLLPASSKTIQIQEQDSIMHLIQLDEIEIKAAKKEIRSLYTNHSSTSIDEHFIKENNIHHFREILSRVPGLTMLNGKVFFRGETKCAAAIIIDDIVISANMHKSNELFASASQNEIRLENIDMYDIERIDFIPASSAVLLGSRGCGGAVVISTKKRHKTNFSTNEPTNIKTICPLGYQLPSQFHSSAFELTEKRESTINHTVTIFWKPNVILSEEGEFSFLFYPDSAALYYITIEGLTENGEIIYEQQIFK